jgi:hypothetical protein
VRPLLRWTSLAGTAALLAVLGEARTHQHNFPLFLGLVLGVAVLIVAVFVATAPRRSQE